MNADYTFLITLAVTAGGAFGLWWLGRVLSVRYPNYVAMQWRYQSITLACALSAWWLVSNNGQLPVSYVTLQGDIQYPATSMHKIGFTGTETWIRVGTQFALIAFIVTTAVVYLQVKNSKGFSLARVSLGKAIALSLPLSLMNSLTEEIIFRVIPVKLLSPFASVSFITLFCAIAFGIPHYFGNPGKIPGVLLAGFLGWVAANSVIETSGVFIAWSIHFVQDVPIITMLILASRKSRDVTN